MGKISPVSIKYIIRASLDLTGVADRPDIIGAVFGQTEGLLGSDLELRELQKSGRIGRIDVKTETKGGKTAGEILLPSSMGKSETAIIAASLETIERVGPCDAKIKVTKIEDVRISKRNQILDRAKQLLAALITEMPDSQALTLAITEDVRAMEVTEYGTDRLPAGPDVVDSDEIILVEGRADVVNLLRYGIRNVVAMKGTKPSQTVVDLTKTKTITVFVDGDRGGELIIRGLVDNGAELDFVARAPDGKEVEELTLKEINKSLRAKIAWEQAKSDYKVNGSSATANFSAPITKVVDLTKSVSAEPEKNGGEAEAVVRRVAPVQPARSLTELKSMADELVGTRGAFVLDNGLNIMGRVPVKELEDTLQNISEGVFAVVMDGPAEQRLVKVAEDKDIKYIVASSSVAKSRKTKILTASDI
ncbi:MAG: DNA primase [DPANN group archaeon]|nr:DNA primase [DPANN group archaeon]